MAMDDGNGTWVEDLSAALVEGADADVWFHAEDHEAGESVEALARTVDETRNCMHEAAAMLLRSREALAALHAHAKATNSYATRPDLAAKVGLLLADMERPAAPRDEAATAPPGP